ncbi:hypothetical protein [Microbacterium sp. T32]|uniref:hypothetical protein n=1 Tax=Microbacterium sp. T32 TaxID=1776083 RepID=UPI0007ABB868|nr:hypothetical protein [Microbacterium sp. T32]KZE41349.1 hypothetical protein AVW09_01835 [Microbacterium sp. T32]
MAKATIEVFAHSDEATEVWYFDTPTPALTLAVQAGVAAIVLTDTEGVPGTSVTYGPHTVSGIVRPGVSNRDATAGGAGKYAAGVTLNGTWEFDGVVSSGTTPTPTTTAQGTKVYVTPGGALTLDSTSNTLVGRVNYTATYAKAAGRLPVKLIGAR